MAPRIPYQDGIEATRQRWNTLDPGKVGYDKLAVTLRTLKQGHNETIDKLAAVEGRLDAIPFPFQGFSS